MGDDEVLCQSMEVVVRVACDHSSVNFFICPNSVFLDSFESSLSIVRSLKKFFCFPYATVLSKCVLSTSKCRLYWGVSSQYILFKYPQWVLPHWVSYS